MPTSMAHITDWAAIDFERQEKLHARPGTMVLVSHDTEFVSELAPDRVLLLPDGTLDYMSDDLLDLVSLA